MEVELLKKMSDSKAGAGEKKKTVKLEHLTVPDSKEMLKE